MRVGMARNIPEPAYVRRPLDQLLKRIGIETAKPGLYDHALTHRSSGGMHNERLEFLGDAILGFVIAAEIYRRFPRSDEGQLSRLRASLVNRETLAELAQGLELGEWLALGDGEMKSGGWRRASILANALEALFGAVYLDQGFERGREVVLSIYQRQLEVATPEEVRKDPKTRLQEWLQARQVPIPRYQTVAVLGEPHCQVFRVECRVDTLPEPVIGEGDSRRRAEQAAAELALQQLNA